MYAQDPLFSTLVLDRFFRILSDSKYLFSINADGSFVLSLIFFKMVEALSIKEVDEMIESLQKEISNPSLKSVALQTPKEDIPPTQTLTPTPTPTPTTQPKEQKEEVQQLKKDVGAELFEKLKAGITDRSYELGKCFEDSISFISYEDGVLTWESCANDEAKRDLKHGWGAISHLVKEIFGFSTKIKHKPCSKEIQPPKQEQRPQPQPQSASMVEDVEVGGASSCVANCQADENTPKEIDGADIQNEPMVQKAIEMFEATKMTIQSKV
jgi:DNA polymerase-3 subunit gamma/tau